MQRPCSPSGVQQAWMQTCWGPSREQLLAVAEQLSLRAKVLCERLGVQLQFDCFGLEGCHLSVKRKIVGVVAAPSST